jgi:hypothetical protein
MLSGRVVAPITTISASSLSISSRQEASYATILTSMSLEASSRLPAILSNSSIKIIAGALSRTA